MTVNISRNDIIWSYIGQILYSGINVLLLPFVLILLPTKHLGLWYTFSSIGALAMLIDFGFATTFTRNIAYSWSGGELDDNNNVIAVTKGVNINYFSKLVITSRKIYFYMGIIVLGILLTIGTTYIYIVAKEDFELIQFLLPWFIFLFSVFLNIYYAYFNPLLKGTGSIKEYYQVIVIVKFIQLLVSIIGLLLGYGLLAVTLAYLISTIITRLLCQFYINNVAKTKNIYKKALFIGRNSKNDTTLIKKLWSSVYKQGLMSLSNYLTDRSSLLIVSAFFGLVYSANYGITIQIFSILATISNVYYNTNIAAIVSDKVNDNSNSYYKKITSSLGIQTIVIVIGTVFIYLFGNSLLGIISSNTMLIDNKQLLVLGLYYIVFNFQLVSSNYIILNNQFPMVKSYLISAILTVTFQIILSFVNPVMNLWNIVIVQLIVVLAYNFWRWPLYVSKENSKTLSTFLIDSFKNGVLQIYYLIKGVEHF